MLRLVLDSREQAVGYGGRTADDGRAELTFSDVIGQAPDGSPVPGVAVVVTLPAESWAALTRQVDGKPAIVTAQHLPPPPPNGGPPRSAA